MHAPPSYLSQYGRDISLEASQNNGKKKKKDKDLEELKKETALVSFLNFIHQFPYMACMLSAVYRRYNKYLCLCVLLQDDHKLSLEELSARYEVDLFKVRSIISLISSIHFINIFFLKQ